MVEQFGNKDHPDVSRTPRTLHPAKAIETCAMQASLAVEGAGHNAPCTSATRSAPEAFVRLLPNCVGLLIALSGASSANAATAFCTLAPLPPLAVGAS